MITGFNIGIMLGQMNVTTANVLTLISLSLGFGGAVLQIYVSARLAKIKEEVMEAMRKELKEAIDKLDREMVTTKDLAAFRENMTLMLDNIRLQIANK